MNPKERISIDEALETTWIRSIGDIEGVRLHKKKSLEDFREFNIQRKFLHWMGVMTVANSLKDAILSGSNSGS